MPKCDFSGWATKNDLKCADGRIIRSNAFKVNDGQQVPLVWNHQHDSAQDILGHAILENKEEGVYAYCSFNETDAGRAAKEAVRHGDVTAMSIWANNLEQVGCEVIHGVIREVSLVLAGANPGAFIESVMIHGVAMGEDDEEGILYTSEGIYLSHADSVEKKDDGGKEKVEKEDGGKTVGDVLDTLTEDQKKAVAIVIAQAVEDSVGESKDKEEEDEEMKHNVFDEGTEQDQGQFLSHADMEFILEDARRTKSLRQSFEAFVDSHDLEHSLDTTGMTVATGKQTYGFNDVDMLYPDYKSLNNPPEWISRNMDWVQKVMSQVHRTPFSRIKSLYADITEDEARAKGYIKGKQKKEEVFTTLKRTTDPQTIYKKQKLDRDDVLDITDFDVVAWIKAEMKVMLQEEKARAILIGDGRLSDAEDKIQPNHIRPVVTDVPLFNTVIKVSVPYDATESDIAKATINAVIRGKKQYKGSGSPTFWTTEDVQTEMLLIEDGIGHKLYKTEAELATALRVREIVPVEPMEGMKITVDSTEYPLIGTIVNLADYNVGADKNAEESPFFEDFDIDYNQMKYLIEGRMSGALVKPFSALTIVLDKAAKPSQPAG